MKKQIKNWQLLIIIGLWFLFSSPFLIRGKVPFPSTFLANNYSPWNQYVLNTGPVKNAAMPDLITQIYPWKEIVIDSFKNGQIPFWNPYVFAGTPLLANYQSAALSPVNILYFLLSFVDAWSLQVLLQPLFAGIFMYLFVKSLKRSSNAAAVSSIAFMFCGFITCWMDYGTLAYSILFLPLALFAVEKIYEDKKWYYFLLLSISIPLSFFSGHFQTSLYFFIFLNAYCLFKYWHKRDLHLFLSVLISVIFGLLIGSPQLLPSIEFYSNSVRSGLFMKTEVIPWGYLPTFIAPDFLGNPVTRNDWFGHYAEWNAYIGVVPLILSFFSFKKKDPIVYFFAAGAIIAILLAFQTPVLDLLIFLKIPVLSTSAASRVIVLFSFCASVLAAYGFDSFIEILEHKKMNFASMVIGGFVILFGALWVVALFKIIIPAEHAAIALSNLKLPSLIFVAFVITVLGVKFLKSNKILVYIPLLIIFLTALDMYRFAVKWQVFDPKNLVYPQVPISKIIPARPSRVFGNFGQELPLTLKTGGLEGYDPLYIERYGEFINAAKDGDFHSGERSVVELSKNGQYTGKVLDFLSVQYIIHKVADGHAVWAFPFWDYPVDQFRPVYGDDKYQIYINDKSLARAYLVNEYKIVADKREILRTIFHGDLDLAKTTILEDNPNVRLSDNGGGSIVIKKYSANNIELSASATGTALLVLSDPYYPGWKAYIDGIKTNIYRADYAFRAVVIPPGSHTVIFTYFPDSFRIGLVLAGIAILGLLCEAIFVWKKYQS